MAVLRQLNDNLLIEIFKRVPLDSYVIFVLVNTTNLVHKFTFFPLHISGNYVSIIRRNNCIYVTVGVCRSVWMTVCYDPMTDPWTLHTRQSSTQTDKHQMSHIYSYLSWWWHTVARHCRENKHFKKNCAPSWLNLQYYTGMDGQQNRKIGNIWSLISSSSAPVHTLQRATVFGLWSAVLQPKSYLAAGCNIYPHYLLTVTIFWRNIFVS